MNNKKLFIIAIGIGIFLIPLLTAGQGDLEVEYIQTPGGEAPQTIEATSIAQYIRYIYNISFGIAAVLGFLALTYAGFLYLSAAGNPSKIQESKQRILSALLGIGILLISYVLLIAINPDLILFSLPLLEDLDVLTVKQTAWQGYSGKLGTIKEIGYMGKELMNAIEDAADYLNSSALGKCLCINAKSLCLCTGGGENDSCEPQTCYIGEDNSGHPCSNYKEMKEKEELLSLWTDEIIYFQNRAVGSGFLEEIWVGNAFNLTDFDDLNSIFSPADLVGLGGEAMRLQKDIDNVLSPTVEYYDDLVKKAQQNQADQATIDVLAQKKDLAKEEKELTEKLRDKLITFGLLVEALKYPTREIVRLPDQCATNLTDSCDAECITMGDDECHDTYTGCLSVCMGLTPCPVIEIAFAYGQIDLLQKEIVNAAQDIMDIVDKIRDIKQKL